MPPFVQKKEKKKPKNILLIVVEEVPSNIILHRLRRPSRYLGGLIFAWGVIMTCTGFVQNFAGLVIIRFLLGLFEYVAHNYPSRRQCEGYPG
jgi:hypothetical protein